jgi:hypothetical protein
MFWALSSSLLNSLKLSGTILFSRELSLSLFTHRSCSPEFSRTLLERCPGLNVEDHISFFTLRQWGELKSGRLVTSQIYVHSKLLIADDNCMCLFVHIVMMSSSSSLSLLITVSLSQSLNCEMQTLTSSLSLSLSLSLARWLVIFLILCDGSLYHWKCEHQRSESSW